MRLTRTRPPGQEHKSSRQGIVESTALPLIKLVPLRLTRARSSRILRATTSTATVLFSSPNAWRSRDGSAAPVLRLELLFAGGERAQVLVLSIVKASTLGWALVRSRASRP